MKPGIIPQRATIARVLDRAIEALADVRAKGDTLRALSALVEDLQETRAMLGVSEREVEEGLDGY